MLVTGRVPGPPLWKVSKEGHALWILPLIDLYPKKMQWDSGRVEKLISESQEFISQPGIANGIATANPFLFPRALSLYNAMVHLPDKKTLADVLPPDLYQRFSILKARYFPRNSGIERLTVSAATNSMQQEILEHENLGPMQIDISRWLKGNKTILRTDTSVGTVHGLTAKELKALTAAMKEVMATPAYAKAEAVCFEGVLAYFEKDLEPVKRRRTLGQRAALTISSIRRGSYGELSDCMDSFSGTADLPAMQRLAKDYPGLAPPFDRADMRKKSRQKWLDAAENALSRNATTFSSLTSTILSIRPGLWLSWKQRDTRWRFSSNSDYAEVSARLLVGHELAEEHHASEVANIAIDRLDYVAVAKLAGVAIDYHDIVPAQLFRVRG